MKAASLNTDIYNNEGKNSRQNSCLGSCLKKVLKKKKEESAELFFFWPQDGVFVLFSS